MTDIEQFFSIPENAKAYSDWIKDPITKRILDLATDAARPIGMAQPTGELALYLQGIAVGMSTMIDFCKNADKLAQPAGVANADIVATFGAADVLNNWGVYPKKSQEK